MRKNPIVSLAATLFIFAALPQLYSQGTFANLDFENARIILDQSSPYYPNAVNATNALPGWTVIGAFSYPDVLYNTVSLGSPAVSIHDTNSGSLTPIQGHYSVYLQGSVGNIAIAQSGQIPTNAHSLTFWSSFTGFQLTFNGQVRPYVNIGSGSGFTIYGVDVSALAGQTEEIRFSGGGLLDNIQFSNQSIPEPTGFALAALGAIILFIRVRK